MKLMAHMIATLAIIGIISGGTLAVISKWADPLIAANKKAVTENAIFLVQPAGKSYEKVKNNDNEIYKVFDENKELIGYSVVFTGNGFQGAIRSMVGLDKDLKKITSIEVLEQSETPGLGTRITEPGYKDQFKGLETEPQINWLKTPPTKPNEIMAITGATISSKSVVAILNEGISKIRALKEGGKL
ncbi:MAG: FMN-binding protein [Melioribacteraceae bacterium]